VHSPFMESFRPPMKAIFFFAYLFDAFVTSVSSLIFPSPVVVLLEVSLSDPLPTISFVPSDLRASYFWRTSPFRRDWVVRRLWWSLALVSLSSCIVSRFVFRSFPLSRNGLRLTVFLGVGSELPSDPRLRFCVGDHPSSAFSHAC